MSKLIKAYGVGLEATNNFKDYSSSCKIQVPKQRVFLSSSIIGGYLTYNCIVEDSPDTLQEFETINLLITSRTLPEDKKLKFLGEVFDYNVNISHPTLSSGMTLNQFLTPSINLNRIDPIFLFEEEIS